MRNAATKILLDTHRLSGCVKEESLHSLNEKSRQVILKKLSEVEVEKNLDTEKGGKEDSGREEMQSDQQFSNQFNESFGNTMTKGQGKDL